MKKSMKRAVKCAAAIVSLTLAGCLLFGCDAGKTLSNYAIMAGIMKDPKVTDVTIKVAVPLDYAKQNTAFLDGVKLAEEDIGKLKSPVNIHVETDDDKGSFSTVIDLVQGYAKQPEVIGVVGHWYSDICSSVTDLYNRNQKTLLVPTVSMTGLTSADAPYIFQNIPNDRQIGKVLCDYAQKQGVKGLVIYYEDSSYGFTMSTEVEKYCLSLGIKVCDKRTGLVLKRDLPEAKRKWDAAGYDGVILISNVEEGAAFVNELKALGSDALILCSDGMDSESLPKLLSDNSGDIYVASIYNSESTQEGIKSFKERFIKQYGKDPDVWAFQGYDCVMTIAHAVAEHEVVTSGQLKDYLETAKDMPSIFGNLNFNKDHEVEGKSIYLKKVSRSGMECVWGGNESGSK